MPEPDVPGDLSDEPEVATDEQIAAAVSDADG